MYLTQNIKYLRKIQNLTQTDLAKKLKVTKGTISAYERGQNTPTFEGLIAIANIFDISLDNLVFRDIEIEGKGEIGFDNSTLVNVQEKMEQLIKMLNHRVGELEREIRRENPKRAKELGIKEGPH